MEEQWRNLDFIGFPDYDVSNLGRIRSLKISGNVGRKKGLMILHQNTAGRYPQVTLCNNGVQKQISVHKAVALAFLPNPSNYKIINHIDENPLNNRADNLEWCTQKYNVNYGTGLIRRSLAFKQQLGIRYKATKGKEVLFFRSLPDAAKKIGCSWGNIYYALTSKTHYSHGYYWERVHKSNKGEPNG